MGSVSSAIGTVLIRMLNTELSRESKQLFEVLCNACRLLTNLHHKMSFARRAVISPGLNHLVQTIADEIEIDTFLFGTTFSERVKSAKDIDKTSEDVTKPTTSGEAKICQANKTSIQSDESTTHKSQMKMTSLFLT